MKERFKGRRFKLWLTLVTAGAAIIILFFFFKNIQTVGQAISALIGILMPFIFGFVMAYLLTPIYNVVVRWAYKGLPRGESGKGAFKAAKVIGTLVCLLILFGIIFGVAALLIPQIVRSVITVAEDLPGKIDDFSAWLTNILSKSGHEEMAAQVSGILDKGIDTLLDWVQNRFLPGASNWIDGITQGVISTAKTIVSFVIGIIVCVYMLNRKERVAANLKRFVIGHFRRDRADKIFDFAHFCNRTFGRFISGKIIDSVIIGIICFIMMLILRLPYPALIATIIGITNIIPFFGPLIGAIPCGILMLMINPWQALIFVILVIALQTFDGYILGPKILGDSTGLASFWVMFAIIVGGGLFGVLGMLLAVPIFAIITYYIDQRVKRKLKDKGYPTETEDYMDFNRYDVDRKDVL